LYNSFNNGKVSYVRVFVEHWHHAIIDAIWDS